MTVGTRMAGACIAAGFLVVAALEFAMTRERTATTILPYVLVGGCVGTALVAFGTALYRIDRRRLDAARVEDAAARVLRAAAHLAAARSAGRHRLENP